MFYVLTMKQRTPTFCILMGLAIYVKSTKVNEFLLLATPLHQKQDYDFRSTKAQEPSLSCNPELNLTMLQWSHVKCSGWKVLPRAVTTWPTIGLLQAAQTPFWVVFTPCFSIFSCKFPSISSKLVLTGSSFWSLSLNVLRDCIRSSNSWVADEALWRLEPRVHTKFEFQFGVQTKLRYWSKKGSYFFIS